MISLGGRVEVAKQSVEAAAYEAARAASIERTQSEAIAAGRSSAASSLHDQDVNCTSTNITVNAAAFNAPIGNTAQVNVTVTCTVNLSDLSIPRSEEHTSELQSLMRISYAVFCLKKK